MGKKIIMYCLSFLLFSFFSLAIDANDDSYYCDVGEFLLVEESRPFSSGRWQCQSFGTEISQYITLSNTSFWNRSNSILHPTNQTDTVRVLDLVVQNDTDLNGLTIEECGTPSCERHEITSDKGRIDFNDDVYMQSPFHMGDHYWYFGIGDLGMRIWWNDFIPEATFETVDPIPGGVRINSNVSTILRVRDDVSIENITGDENAKIYSNGTIEGDALNVADVDSSNSIQLNNVDVCLQDGTNCPPLADINGTDINVSKVIDMGDLDVYGKTHLFNDFYVNDTDIRRVAIGYNTKAPYDFTTVVGIGCKTGAAVQQCYGTGEIVDTSGGNLLLAQQSYQQVEPGIVIGHGTIPNSRIRLDTNVIDFNISSQIGKITAHRYFEVKGDLNVSDDITTNTSYSNRDCFDSLCTTFTNSSGMFWNSGAASITFNGSDIIING